MEKLDSSIKSLLKIMENYTEFPGKEKDIYIKGVEDGVKIMDEATKIRDLKNTIELKKWCVEKAIEIAKISQGKYDSGGTLVVAKDIEEFLLRENKE